MNKRLRIRTPTTASRQSFQGILQRQHHPQEAPEPTHQKAITHSERMHKIGFPIWYGSMSRRSYRGTQTRNECHHEAHSTPDPQNIIRPRQLNTATGLRMDDDEIRNKAEKNQNGQQNPCIE